MNENAPLRIRILPMVPGSARTGGQLTRSTGSDL